MDFIAGYNRRGFPVFLAVDCALIQRLSAVFWRGHAPLAVCAAAAVAASQPDVTMSTRNLRPVSVLL